MRHPIYLYQRVCLCVCVYLYMFLIYILGPCYFVRYFYFFVSSSSPRPFVSCHTRCRTRIPPYARCMTTLTTRPRTRGTSTKTPLGRAYYFLNIIHNNITYTKTRRIIYTYGKRIIIIIIIMYLTYPVGSLPRRRFRVNDVCVSSRSRSPATIIPYLPQSCTEPPLCTVAVELRRKKRFDSGRQTRI